MLKTGGGGGGHETTCSIGVDDKCRVAFLESIKIRFVNTKVLSNIDRMGPKNSTTKTICLLSNSELSSTIQKIAMLNKTLNTKPNGCQYVYTIHDSSLPRMDIKSVENLLVQNSVPYHCEPEKHNNELFTWDRHTQKNCRTGRQN